MKQPTTTIGTTMSHLGEPDLLERLRKADEVNEIQTAHLSAIQSAAGNPDNLLHEVGRLRVENERLRENGGIVDIETPEGFLLARLYTTPGTTLHHRLPKDLNFSGDDALALRAENERLRVKLASVVPVLGEGIRRPLFCPAHGKRLPCPACSADNCAKHMRPMPCGECIADITSGMAAAWNSSVNKIAAECKAAFDPAVRPIWEIAAEIGSRVPPEEWAKVPTDLSMQRCGGFTPRPRRSLWPLALAAVAVWTFIALQRGWFSSAWSWIQERLSQ